MAGLWCDHFGQFAATADMLNGVYAQVDGPDASGGISIETSNPPRAGGNNLRFDHNHFTGPGPVLRRIFGAPKTAAGVAWRVWIPNLPISEQLGQTMLLLVWVDAANAIQVQVALGTDGSLILFRGGALGDVNGAVQIDRSLPCIQANAYNHVEGKAVIDASGGAVEVRVNGVTRLNFSGDTQATANTETSQISMQGPGGGASVAFMDMADLHAWDTDAGDGPTDFVGNVGVLRRKPSADTADAGWSLSTGSTAYSLLNDGSDATYIEADSTTLKSGVSCDALVAGVTGVVYQQLSFRGLKTDAGDCDVAPSFKSSGSESTVTGQPMTTAETWRWGIVGNDPATSAPWTGSGVNASEACVTRTL